jgi:hypothetical protein
MMVHVNRVVLAFLLLGLIWVLCGQDEVVERVEVVNREVVVRVFDGGEPVSGLTRRDFTLTENGEPVIITSCHMERRTLAPAKAPAAEEAIVEKQRGRLFLFLLWWNEESRDWPKAWEYFLRNIFRLGDRIILANDLKVIQVANPSKEKEKLFKFFQGTQELLKRKRLGKADLFARLNNCAGDFHEIMLAVSNSNAPIQTPELVYLNAFKNCYQSMLAEYRLQRLKAQPGMLERLADGLRAVDAGKWVLLFLQNERLPLVHKKSRLFTDTPMKPETVADLGRFIDMCDKDMRMATDMAVHIRDLRSLFIGAGATFHLFLSDAGGEVLDTDYLRWFPVFSSWESAFRGIAKDTGGDVQDTTRLKEALEKAASRPDIYYVLTYKPGTPDTGKPKLKVEVSRPGVKAVYARKLKPREIRPLKLSEPAWKEGILRFTISDYLRETVKGGTIAGDVHVKVSSETFDGDPLEFEKVFHPKEESASVEMKVNFPEPGDYIITVAVTDRLSGNSARNYTRVSIAAPEPESEDPLDPKLKAVLDKAAVYCRRLQKAAFRFTCTEVVEEKVLKRNPVSKRVEPETNRWNYDYQVVADQEKVSEQRILVRRGHKKVNMLDAKLETRFKANYSVFLPTTLLGEHNRTNYIYSLLESVRLKKRNCAVIEVTPRKPGQGPLARGKAWLDVENGSILKIEMDPRGVAGSAVLEAAAKKMSARLDLKAIHWCLEERKGLRFPSSTEFSESYVFKKKLSSREVTVHSPSDDPDFAISKTIRVPSVEARHRRVEFYRLTQSYKKYRYFEVDTRVETEPLPNKP